MNERSLVDRSLSERSSIKPVRETVERVAAANYRGGRCCSCCAQTTIIVIIIILIIRQERNRFFVVVERDALFSSESLGDRNENRVSG